MTWFSEFKLKEKSFKFLLGMFLLVILINFVSADFKFENTSGTELMKLFSSSGNLSVLGKINASDVCVGNICLGSLGASVSGDYVPYTGAIKSINLNAMNLTNVGKIGIGTTTPQSLLNILTTYSLNDSSTISNYPLLISTSLSGANPVETGIAFRISTAQSSDKTPGAAIIHKTTGSNSAGDLLFKVVDSHTGTTPLVTRMIIKGGGNVGIGTTSPTAKLQVAGNVSIGGNLTMNNNRIINLANGTAATDAVTKSQLDAVSSTVSGDFVPYTGATKNVNLGSRTLTTTGAVSVGALTSTTINTGQGVTEVYLMDQNVRTTDNVSFNNLRIGNNQWISAIDSSGTGVINMFKVNPNNEIDVGGTLNIGTLSLSEDSGLVTLVNMPVSSATSAGSAHGYVFGMDSENILTVYSESDGAGGVQNKRIGIGTISPTANLDVNGTVNFRGSLAMNNNKITGLANGSVAQDAITYSQMIFTNSSMKSYVDSQVGSTFSGWKLAGDSGTAQTVASGQTVNITGGTSINTSVSATNKLTINIKQGGVGSDQIANNAITNYKIATNSINSSQLIANSVNSSHIVAGSIGSNQIANNAVIKEKIAANSVNGSHIISNSVNSTHIINGAITSDDLANGAVTNYKIAANAVNITQTTFTDQNLTASSTPTFNRLNITNAPTQGSHALNRDAGDARYVNLAGDTMTGNLTLANAPSLDLHAATKKYVDEAVTTGVGSGFLELKLYTKVYRSKYNW